MNIIFQFLILLKIIISCENRNYLVADTHLVSEVGSEKCAGKFKSCMFSLLIFKAYSQLILQ